MVHARNISRSVTQLYTTNKFVKPGICQAECFEMRRGKLSRVPSISKLQMAR